MQEDVQTKDVLHPLIQLQSELQNSFHYQAQVGEKEKLSRPVSADKCSEWPWTRPSFWLDVRQIGGFGFEVKAYTLHHFHVWQRSCFPKPSALCGLHHCIIISLHSYSVVLQRGYYHTKHQYASYFTWVCLFWKGRAKIHSDICYKCNISK